MSDWMERLSDIARRSRCWVVWLSTSETDHAVVAQAAPWLTPEEVEVLTAEGFTHHGFVREGDARAAYGQTVGDDGPTDTNPYRGPGRVYACLCSPDGVILTENT